MNVSIFQSLLKSFPKTNMRERPNSRINHHANGMDYLCLFRNESLTVKLYYISERTQNKNGDFLVSPHNHRYAFDSVVLFGEVDHIRFPGVNPPVRHGDYQNWLYCAESKLAQKNSNEARYNLPKIIDRMKVGDSWHIDPDDVHTLRVVESEECLIGIIQYHDEKLVSELYVKHDVDFADLPVANTYAPGPIEMQLLWEKCLSLALKGGLIE